MSVQAISWALSVRTRSATHKAVLLVLANYANDVHACWPAQQVIADEACCSLSTVHRTLRDLENDGLIEREARRRKNGSHTSDRIVLLVKHPAVNLTVSQSDCQSDTPLPPVKLTDPVRDKPLLEPTIEPLEYSGDARARDDLASVKRTCFAALGPGAGDPAKTPTLHTTANAVAAWLRHGCDLDADVLPTIAALTAQPRASPITTWKFFEQAVYRARDLRLAAPPEAIAANPASAKTPGAPHGRRADQQPQSAAEIAMERWRARERLREAGGAG